jgi:hypothetical protein
MARMAHGAWLTAAAAGGAVALQPDDRVPTVRVLQAGEAGDGGYKFGLVRHWP